MTLTSFDFLQSIRTTQPSRTVATVQLLSWTLVPYSTIQAQRSTGPAAVQATLVPSSGFGYPRDGLLPPSPSEFLIGSQRSWDSPFGALLLHEVSRRSRIDSPTCRFFPRLMPGTNPGHGDTNRGSWALSPRESLTWDTNAPGYVAPMGFSFLGFCRPPTLILPSEDLLSCAWLR